MKIIGGAILALGLLLGIYALTMNVGVEVPSKDLGFGITTPAMVVANADLMSQRQNYLIFSGILSVVGAILLGFGAIAPKEQEGQQLPAYQSTPLPEIVTNESTQAHSSTSISICPKCRHMGSGDAVACDRCGSPIAV